MLPFLRKNHHVTTPHLQQLHMRDDIIKKHLCVLPLTLTAHRQWGKLSARFFTLSFLSHNYKAVYFAITNLLQGQAALKGKSVGSYIPPFTYASPKDQDAAGQAGADGALWPCPLTHTVAPRWPNPKLHRKLDTLQLAPCSWSALSSAGLHY